MWLVLDIVFCVQKIIHVGEVFPWPINQEFLYYMIWVMAGWYKIKGLCQCLFQMFQRMYLLNIHITIGYIHRVVV